MVEWMKIALLILALRLIKARGSNLFVAINDCTCEGHNVMKSSDSLIQKIIWLLYMFKMIEWMKLALLILALRLVIARGSYPFVAINDCTCEGHNVTYECTVFGNGATIWKGTAFADCSSTNEFIIMFHSINFTSQRPQTCNNGAIVGRAVRAENGSYKSQITIRVSNDFNGTSVVCAHDNGTLSTEIGSAILNITAAPFPPPTDVQSIEVNHTSIRFNWSHVSSHCPSLHYHIMADNCGECPNATTTNITTCTGDYTHLISDRSCSFAVRTAVCNGTVGDISIAITVTKVTENLHMEEGTRFIILSMVVPTTVVLMMGITLVLGIALVYLIISKKSTRTKSLINNRTRSTPVPGTNKHNNMVAVELTAGDNNQQGIEDYSYLQPTKHQEQSHNESNSRSIGDMTYADLGPNPFAGDAHLQTLVCLSDDDRVQYEEIQLQCEADTGVPVCGSQTILVNLDLLLILLKDELTPKWYDFGLEVGVPKEVMDGYVGHPSDQCLIEVLDYWLRHHSDQLTWGKVAQALREIKVYELAEKAQQISTTGKFCLEADSRNFSQCDLESNIKFNDSPPALSDKQQIQDHGTVKYISSTPEYEDTADLLSPPPLPPKGGDT